MLSALESWARKGRGECEVVNESQQTRGVLVGTEWGELEGSSDSAGMGRNAPKSISENVSTKSDEFVCGAWKRFDQCKEILERKRRAFQEGM